jgi:NADH-quinone oxidoreductase subunit J
MILISNNIIYSLFFLIITALSIIILFIFLGREFVAFVFLIVYVGAICILFLFVIMMLNIQMTERTERKYNYNTLICVFVILFMLLLILYYIINNQSNDIFLFYTFSSYNNLIFDNKELKILADLLYNYNGLNFFISGLILLIAMIGAITISLDLNKNNYLIVKKQDVFLQLSKDLNVSIYLIKK